MKKNKAFTLIETIVVVAVLGLTLPVIFSIFFVILQQQTKIYRLNTTKKEGDYIINILENTIKNQANSIHSAKPLSDANKECATDSSNYGVSPSVTKIYFLDNGNNWFGYSLNNSSIASDSALLGLVDLTSSKTRINNFSISCSRTYKYSQPTVSLSFDIEFCNDVACSQTRPEETSSLHYQTKIKLRNY